VRIQDRSVGLTLGGVGLRLHDCAPSRDLCTAGGAKFGENVCDVRGDGLGRQHELLGDLLVREPVCDEPGELELALTQWMPR